MDEGSKRRKKKRGRSLIFKTCFRPATSGDDHGGRILASDDNLVYCDVTNPGANDVNVDAEVKKSSSSRGRMSRIFKAVLFDTAVKKKMRGKRSSKTSFESANSSPGPIEKTNDPFNEVNNPNNVKLLEADNSSNDNTSKTDANPVASSSCLSSADNSANHSSQTLTERKATPRVNSMDKKPPLIPSSSRPSVKPVHAKDSKHVALNKSSFHSYLFITLIVVFVLVLVVLWMSYTTIGVKSLDIDSNQYTNIVVVGDEL